MFATTAAAELGMPHTPVICTSRVARFGSGLPSRVSSDAVPPATVNAALSPEASESPLVRAAVRTTPGSALLYVTPAIVTEVVPAAIVPDVVPPSAPVPLVRDSCTVVDAATLAAF